MANHTAGQFEAEMEADMCRYAHLGEHHCNSNNEPSAGTGKGIPHPPRATPGIKPTGYPDHEVPPANNYLGGQSYARHLEHVTQQLRNAPPYSDNYWQSSPASRL